MTVVAMFCDPPLSMGARVQVTLAGTTIVGSLRAYSGGLDDARMVTIQADDGAVVHAPLYALRMEREDVA